MENIKVELNNLSEGERQTLLQLISKANAPCLWKPNAKGERFFIITSTGNVMPRYNKPGCKEVDRYEVYFETGNCFRTPDDARFTIERLKVIQKLREIASKDRVPNWKDGKRYGLTYNLELDRVVVFETDKISLGTDVYFASKFDAEQAVQEVGMERVKKYYFLIV